MKNAYFVMKSVLLAFVLVVPIPVQTPGPLPLVLKRYELFAPVPPLRRPSKLASVVLAAIPETGTA